MDSKNVNKFFIHWCLGFVLAFIILLIVWFTGLSGYAVDEYKSFDDFFYAIIHSPHIVFGLPAIIGLFFGIMIPKNEEKKDK